MTAEQGSVCVPCIYKEEGTLRFTVLAAGLEEWVDRCRFPHRLALNVPRFVFLFKKPMKRISRKRRWQAAPSVHPSVLYWNKSIRWWGRCDGGACWLCNTLILLWVIKGQDTWRDGWIDRRFRKMGSLLDPAREAHPALSLSLSDPRS